MFFCILVQTCLNDNNISKAFQFAPILDNDANKITLWYI